MRCTLSRNTQPPSLMYLLSTASAGPSCPWPMEMSVSVPASGLRPVLRAYASISLEGE